MAISYLVDSVGPAHQVSGEEVDRETLTGTLFRCIEDCTNDDEAQSLRAQVVALNIPVADSLARRYFGHGELSDDLKQVAYLGLTKAAAGFDAARGKNFLSYAVPTITGELKKHFRDRCWTVRPPRRIQDLQREIGIARESLSQDTHHQPSVGELAAHLDVSATHVTEAMAAQGCFSPSSLDSPLREDSTTTHGELLRDDGQEFDRCEGHLLLEPLIRALPESDRQILALRFFEDWTQDQIAERLGTTQMQVSRRLSRLLSDLRTHLETDEQVSA